MRKRKDEIMNEISKLHRFGQHGLIKELYKKLHTMNDNDFTICINITIHSFGKNPTDFDIVNTNIPDTYNKPELQHIIHTTYAELNGPSEILRNIHKQLWNKYKKDKYYKLHIGLKFPNENEIYTNMTNNDIIYDYKILDNVDYPQN